MVGLSDRESDAILEPDIDAYAKSGSFFYFFSSEKKKNESIEILKSPILIGCFPVCDAYFLGSLSLCNHLQKPPTSIIM